MKKYIFIGLVITGLGSMIISCEKEQPAVNIEGNYTGVIQGVYNGNDTIKGDYPVYASAESKNVIKIEGSLFPSFTVLVTQNGINVIPVSTDDEVYELLYQGDLKELTFKYYKGGDSTHFVGTKP